MLARMRSCFLLSFWLAFSVVTYLPVQAQSNGVPLSPAAPQKKEINDPAEHNAYVSAIQQSNAAAKVSGLEAFLAHYPDSVMKEDALEGLMIAYRQANNPKMVEAAQMFLQVNPCNVRALARLAYTEQAMATAGQNPQQNLADAGESAEKGLQCLQIETKPDGTSDADWRKLKAQAKAIFSGAVGLNAFQVKDYAKAVQYLRAAVEADPSDLADVYDLALAYLEPGPEEKDVEGLFFIARAANLKTGAGKDQIAEFGKIKYTKYHGSDEGWKKLLALTATTSLPPAAFTITQYVPPTPVEQSEVLIKAKKVEEMSFAERQKVLSGGTPEDADKVRSVLKRKPLQMQAHVISVDPPSKSIDAQGKSVQAPTKRKLAGSSDGVPPSVTSIGFGGKLTHGVRPSVTSHGPNRHGSLPFWGGCCFVVGIFEPVYVPYAVPYAPEDGDDSLDVVDYVHAPGPQDSDMATNRAGDSDSALNADDFGQPAPDEAASGASTPDDPEDPVTAQPSTVLVFKDGHRSDVLNYAIVGDALFDFDFEAGRTRKILLADLDLPATQKANDDRGVDFQIPASPARR